MCSYLFLSPLLLSLLLLSLLPSIPFVAACAPGQAKVAPHGTCVDCTPGFYAPTLDTPACIPCPRGSSSPQSAAASCTLCAPGTIQPSEGASNCAPCPRGSVQPFLGRLDCLPCPPGSIPNTEKSECVPCAIGTAGGSKEDGWVCETCSTGKAAPQVGLSECISCPVGTYSGAGGTRCLPCSTGYVTLGVESWEESQCIDCQTLFNSTFGRIKDMCVVLKCAPFLSKTSPFIEARIAAEWVGDGESFVSGAGCELVQKVAPAGSPLTLLAPSFSGLDNSAAKRIGLWLLQALIVGLMLNAVWSFLHQRCLSCRRGGKGRGGGEGGPSPMIAGRLGKGAETQAPLDAQEGGDRLAESSG